ncbi:DeoR/GlpR family DNA-binding transcription regulator [Pullulanibacillus sp. KACC 23026]|uniref:DeoR/GlpR family DNA-binding transcription regulator n=1 Tax=Pullulanibacillus sp. KACC 23026 TaxID=3028315 RepID=UPI0023B17139|nr:DeoR/GlpR family DNA-binding transcription regulator [Pullulanibacillus sp. KACC 23026]WEG13038.1 DeoR/GlpR family DNA-binding transcription regulator [Pullulanibacillus sp. KACC 23026]
MLTPERHRVILDLINNQRVATVQELAEATSSSESTIRRDLLQLESEGKLTRFHGGAESVNMRSEETAFIEKVNQNQSEKAAIGQYAAKLVQPGDCIYLDAGTTTAQMIPHLNLNTIVVTNGLSVVESCLIRGLKTYLVGGEIKEKTRAVIGSGAVLSLHAYRFDKCFLGMNGVDHLHGFTTPDPEEASVKQMALKLATESYVLADASKWGKVSFSFVSDLESSTLITNAVSDMERLRAIQAKTHVEVVTQ